MEKEEIKKRVTELAKIISKDYANQQPVLLGVLKGSFIFLSDLVRELTIPVEIDFVWLSSYGKETSSSGQITLHTPPQMSLAGRDVLIVEEIVDTGRSVMFLKEYLATVQKVNSSKICAFIDKPERREVPIAVDYVSWKEASGFLVGYGLDYANQYRELPAIFQLKPEEIS